MTERAPGLPDRAVAMLSRYPLYQAVRSGIVALLWLLPTPLLAYLPGTLALGLVLAGIGAVLAAEAGTPARAERVRARRLSPLWLTALPIPVTIAYLMAQPVYIALVRLPSSPPGGFGAMMTTTIGAVTVFLVVAVFGPLVEELYFRGKGQRALEQAWGVHAAVVASSLLFALMHFEMRLVPYHFGMGLLFGYAMVLSRSVWAPVVLHATTNGVNQLLEMRFGDASPHVLPRLLHLGVPECAVLLGLSVAVAVALMRWLALRDGSRIARATAPPAAPLSPVVP